MSKQHELVGSILWKDLRRVYNRQSPYYGNVCYKLGINNEKKNTEEFLFVYPNVVKAEIFQVIENSNYVDKRYLFFYQKKPKKAILLNWQELTI